MKLKNKIAIVTGGSRGIGAAISREYAKQGASVIVVNKNNPKDADRLVNDIVKSGGKAESIICDISNLDSVNDMVLSVINKYQRIDILVNCAGVLKFNDLDSHTIEDWNFVLTINLTGTFLLAKTIAPFMKKQTSGKMILFSSLAAIRGVSGAISYSASKGGVLAMAKSLVAELAQYGINVNTISPGFTASPMNASLRDDPDFLAQIKKPPTGNSYMQPSDLVGAAVFLASADSDHVYGLDLIVDDGATTVQ